MRRLLLPLLAVVLLLPTLALGVYLGGHPDTLPTFVRDTLVADSQGRVYDEAVDLITEDFYKRVDREDLLNRSIEAAVKALDDPFSHYFDPEAYSHFQEVTNGAFQGVGVGVLEHPKGLRIVRVFKRGPAAEAGLERGDLVVAVGGKSLRGRAAEESAALIKGPSGTRVELTIERDGRRRTLTVARASVDIPVVSSRLERSDGRRIAYVKLDSFISGAHGEVRRAVRGLLDRGADGVVLDLRDNGGGLLDEAVLVSSLFVPEGTIVSTRGRARPSRSYEASGRSIDTDVPVVVLVNRASASASEIVAGALQDRDRATVVGTRTFGKGVFQEVSELANGGALDITVGEYFTPDGRNLGPRDGKPGGIQPDVRAEDDPDTRRDEGLRAAIRALPATA